jgi:nitrite reductase/ring-hydroxylating ferredoxin subunit/uncharacterized membrane protein
MRTRASLDGHPIHPMLIPYPFAFLTGGWGFGVAAAITGNKDLQTVSRYLIPTGIAAGLVAAVPGIVDYVQSVPPRSSAKERARTHGMLNSAALTLFATGWWLSRRSRRTAAPLVVQGLGAAAMSTAAWMGGVLVNRNQIGVDHRYANAGKWQEEGRQHAQSRALAFASAPLDVNQMKLVHVHDRRIAVARTERGLAAFDDRCTHKGGPLSDGVLICGTVQCPWHGSQFDVNTGEVKCGPAEEPIGTYDVDQLPSRPVHQLPT